MRRILFILSIAIIFLALRQVVSAKVSTHYLLFTTHFFSDSTPDKKRILILHTDRLSIEKRDTLEFQTLAGHDTIRQENVLFYCDSAVLDKKKNVLEAFGRVHINDADSIHTYSDYLKYYGNEKRAYLNGNVRLTQDKGTLTTPDLDYDLNTKVGVYTKGGKLVSGTTTLTSREGYYYGVTKDAYFKKKVVLVSPDNTVKTDTLLYNTGTNIATFVVPTEIITKGSTVRTREGTYDLTTKESRFAARPEIITDSSYLIADRIANNDSTGAGEADGNVLFRDVANGYTVFADNLKSNRKRGAFLATKSPVMILRQDQDSIFIAADTFYSARIKDFPKERRMPVIRDSARLGGALEAPDSARDRFIEAFYHVKIFSDSLQAAGDSLFYAAADSAFRLFKDPVIWSRESQITGDTIYLYTANKKPERMQVIGDALILSQAGTEQYYDQIRGRTVQAFFRKGEIDSMHVRGAGISAESVYYIIDDSTRYTGVNHTTSDVIDLRFRDRKLQKVRFINNVDGTTFPMKQANHEALKVKGFKWEADRRPKSRYALFGK